MKRKLYTCALVSTVVLGCADGSSNGTTPGSGGSGGSSGSAGTSGKGGGGRGGAGGDGAVLGDAGPDARDVVVGADGSAIPIDASVTGDGGPVPLTQTLLNAIGASTQLTYTLVENIPMIAAEGGMVADCPPSAGGLCANAQIALKNVGSAWNATGWAIYFSNIRKVVASSSPEFTITHINGDLHKIEPAASFLGFAAGETKEIPLKSLFWTIAESDLMPRWYVAAPGLAAVVLAHTNTEDLSSFVTPFTDPKQTHRHPIDQVVIETAATRFAENTGIADWDVGAVASEVVPAPQTVTKGAGFLDLSAGVTIVTSVPTDVSADGLASVKARLTTLGVTVKDEGGVAVRVSVNPADAAFSGKASAEAYRLTVDSTGVTIVGRDAAGAFYGLQTLVALLPAEFSATKSIPQLKVDYDAPRYAYRGVQLDLARNFHTADEVKKIVEQLAAYKLNVLHLHLSEDEGWRLEIPGLPELTSVGAKRCHDLTEKTCLLPQLGSGPDTTTAGSGNLARAEFIEILKFAAARYIEVIPEFDMPGHARAAIKAMQARGEAAYLLSDPMDASKYESAQFYKDNAINGCMDSSYAFIEKVMDEVKAMYTEAGVALKTWHVGLDEVAPGTWTESPLCKTRFAGDGGVKNADEVHGYFVRRVNALAKARGFAIQGWSDGLRKTVAVGDAGTTEKQFLDLAADLDNNPVRANWWGTLFWWDYHNSAYTLANKGYQVILTSPDFLYLDHPYEADPKERGYYWATRSTGVRKLFGYMPGNLPANSKLTKDRMGGDYQAAFDPPMTDPTPPVNLNPAAASNIIGLEGAHWGETSRSAAMLEGLVFPRLLAMAERAWHRASWEPADVNGTDWGKAVPIDTAALKTDWERFANVLGHKELPKLGKMGVEYRVEIPGAVIDAGVLRANVSLPGLVIEYKNGAEWTTYVAASPPTTTSTEVRAKTSQGRAGRAIPVTP
ncbi:MAG TPA: family 20 glycosylhydrolase [Polyangiaceae bacterium]|nr:family 20 glycosylhydrolase [Polyangiaceae bacterium]